MTVPFLRSKTLALALAGAVLFPAAAQAEVAVRPGNRIGLRAQRGAMARRVRPVPVPTGPPPVRQVRQALRQSGPLIQQCASQYEPPGRGRVRRLRVRVWLYPNGRWTMEVPELTARRPGQPAQSYAALRACIRAGVGTRIQPHMRRFRGRRRQKVERAFRVRMPGPPPSEAALSRRVRRVRRRLLQCVPGSGRQGERAEMTVQATLQTNGQMTLTGLGLPQGVPFDAAAACVRGALATISNDAVTTQRSFEATIRFRYQAPTPPQVQAPNPQPVDAAQGPL